MRCFSGTIHNSSRVGRQAQSRSFRGSRSSAFLCKWTTQEACQKANFCPQPSESGVAWDTCILTSIHKESKAISLLCIYLCVCGHVYLCVQACLCVYSVCTCLCVSIFTSSQRKKDVWRQCGWWGLWGASYTDFRMPGWEVWLMSLELWNCGLLNPK